VREWFKVEYEALGCTVSVDEVGNMFARRPCKNDNLLSIAKGVRSTPSRPEESSTERSARSKRCPKPDICLRAGL
jgi:hypothetical protein